MIYICVFTILLGNICQKTTFFIGSLLTFIALLIDIRNN